MEQPNPVIPEDAVIIDENSINEGNTRSANNKWLMVGTLVVLSVIVLVALVIWLLNSMYSDMDKDIDTSLQEIETLQDDIDMESMSELDDLELEPEEEVDLLLNEIDTQLEDIEQNVDLEDFEDPGL